VYRLPNAGLGLFDLCEQQPVCGGILLFSTSVRNLSSIFIKPLSYFLHSDLKGVYFTMLERFAKTELVTQKKQLEEMLQCCLEKAKQIREITKPSKKQRKEKRRKEESQERVEDTERLQEQEQDKEQQSSSFPPSYEYSQNRRRTLRRQIEKIDMILANHTCSSTEERGNEIEALTGDCSALLPMETDNSLHLVPVDCDNMQEINAVNAVNPKVRYGWGFWRN
jgi:hypothetical protein